MSEAQIHSCFYKDCLVKALAGIFVGQTVTIQTRSKELTEAVFSDQTRPAHGSTTCHGPSSNAAMKVTPLAFVEESPTKL